MQDIEDVESTLVVVPAGTNININGLEFGLLDDCFVFGSMENIAVIRDRLLVPKKETRA